MRRDPRVTLLCYDPREPLRYLEIRGVVVGPDRATVPTPTSTPWPRKYLGRPVRSTSATWCRAELATVEVPILCRIRPAPRR
jgi:hypothetical protein